MENMDMRKMSASSLLKGANKGKGLSVRRCLFGPVDHAENTRFLKHQLKLQEEESCKKWNFDFNTMTPLEGKYTWEPVSTNSEIPKAYELKHLAKPTPTRARTPLGLSSRLNANIVPLSKVESRFDSQCPSVSLLLDDCVRTDSENTSESSPESSPSQTSNVAVTSKKTAAKRKLSQTDITGKTRTIPYTFFKCYIYQTLRHISI